MPIKIARRPTDGGYKTRLHYLIAIFGGIGCFFFFLFNSWFDIHFLLFFHLNSLINEFKYSNNNECLLLSFIK